MLKHITKAGFAALAVAVMLSTPAQADTVVATVAGQNIYKEQVKEAMKALKIKSSETDQAYPLVLNQMINEKLIDMEIEKSGIEKSADFQKRLEATKQQMIKTIYLEKYLKDKVNDKTVKAEYDKIRKANKGKQEVHARHILVKTEEEAVKIIKELDGGAKFVDLAKKKSEGPAAQNGGDVGYFAKGEVVPEFSDAAFALKPGTYTKKPVKTQFGWHVIYVEDKRERKVPELKAVDGIIRNKLGQEAVEDLIRKLRTKADIKQFTMDGKPL